MKRTGYLGKLFDVFDASKGFSTFCTDALAHTFVVRGSVYVTFRVAIVRLVAKRLLELVIQILIPYLVAMW